MALGLAAAGADVAVWGTNPAKNKAALEQLQATGQRVVATVCATCATRTRSSKHSRRPCNNLENRRRLRQRRDPRSADSLRRHGAGPVAPDLAGHLDGVFLTLREGARHLIQRGEGGSLVAVSSTSRSTARHATHRIRSPKRGFWPSSGAWPSNWPATASAATPCCPDSTETELTARGHQNEKFVANTTYRTPVKRWAQPSEFGPAAVYLADPRIGFHTGDALVIDGGNTVF